MSYMERHGCRFICHDVAVFLDNIVPKERCELDYMVRGTRGLVFNKRKS